MTLFSEILIAFAWPISAVVVSVLAYRVAQKFVPARSDKTLAKIQELEKALIEQQTEISKLNVLFGIGQTQENRKNLIRGLTGAEVGR